ncbi:hypothetical protein L210DRAFT_2338446 [Boletus edulis BED1]|uniref:Uncharacterized protein n=1 Tax=Boletus edulis BED1 TaxID=1328754 RepID=A0AAD4GCN3_BOLED|nr:hypothetical protein L210DRAFT_2338446 [Boletus edulis BED1]
MRSLLQLSSPPTPLLRALEIARALDPVRLAQVFLDFASVVRSQFWDGRRTGPDFVSPMTSLTKRQSGHLAKLVLQHSKSIRTFVLDRTDASLQVDDLQNDPHVVLNSSSHTSDSDAALERPAIHPQAVAVLDLDDVRDRHLESQYSTSADVDLMVLVPILLSLLVILRTHQWSPASEFIAIDFIAALILGPGTLTLIRRTALHPTELDPGPGCAVLMDDDFTAVIRGSQRIVEAVTEGGFYLSFADHRTAQGVIPITERWQEKQVVSDLLYGSLEGGCRGVCEAIVMRLLHLHFNIPYLKEIVYVVVFGRMMIKACWWGLMASANDSIPPVAEAAPLRSVARLTGEFLGLLIVAASIASTSSATIFLHGVSFFVQSSYFGLFARLVLQSQNYRIRTQRFLDGLGRPPIKKWPFRTRASAATFVCLVLCRDIPRPVRSINVLGVLDALIPNQRDVWRVWKERVADRIAHEEYITFAPTIPTFPDERQRRLKRLLDEAQSAYEKYRSHYCASDASDA